MPEQSHLITALGGLAGLGLAYQLLLRRSKLPPLPPGPRSYPLIGQMLSIPSGNEHLAWIEMGKKLNSMYLINKRKPEGSAELY